MAEVKILEYPSDEQRLTSPAAGVAEGDWLTPGVTGLEKIDAATEVPAGVVVQSESTEFPPQSVLVLGDGALLDLGSNISAAAPGTPFYSDGDGTISSSQPSGVAGTIIYRVGYTVGNEDGDSTTTILRVDIDEYEKGA